VLPPPSSVVPPTPTLAKGFQTSQIKEDPVPSWVPAERRNLALVEIIVPRASGGAETIVVSGTTARLIQVAGDAVFDGGQLRFPKWNCQVAVENRKET
jgi:hypothetical protein